MSRKKITPEQRAANAKARAEITDDERARVLELVQTRGMPAACKALQLDKTTITRLLSPLPVRRQTAHWLRNRLELLA